MQVPFYHIIMLSANVKRGLAHLRRTCPYNLSGVWKAILGVENRATLLVQMDEIDLFEVIYTKLRELSHARGMRRLS